MIVNQYKWLSFACSEIGIVIFFVFVFNLFSLRCCFLGGLKYWPKGLFSINLMWFLSMPNRGKRTLCRRNDKRNCIPHFMRVCLFFAIKFGSSSVDKLSNSWSAYGALDCEVSIFEKKTVQNWFLARPSNQFENALSHGK